MNVLQERSMFCCGWTELTGLNLWDGTRTHFNELFKQFAGFRIPTGMCGSVLFTTNTREEANLAVKLAALIKHLKLGKVVKIPRFTNPNTNNLITSYVWILDKPAVVAYTAKIVGAKKEYGRW
jgi:hypothetical protein